MSATALLLVGMVCAASPTPHGCEPVGLADVRWTNGLWAERFEVCRTGSLPAMTQLMHGTQRSHFLHNFRIACGLELGKHRGPAWNDGDLYKWLEALAAVYAVTKEPALSREMDAVIAVLAKAQRADGYLHTPVLIAQRNGDTKAKPFQDRLHFEMYNFGHLFTAGCVHYRATGKKSLLDVAIKAADFLCRTFEKPTPELARNSVCPSHYMGAVELYRTTKDKRYLALAVKFLDMRDLPTEIGTDDNQDRIPFRAQTNAVGHAVRANYLYAGAADVYAETADETLMTPLVKIWNNVVSRKMYLTGACGALYDGASPDGSKNQKQIGRIHQAYGRDYQLPHSTAHNETCASIGNALWNWRMLQVAPEVKYADVLELTLYNALLAGVSLDGKKYFYTNTLRQLDTMPTSLRWSRMREEWISCYCCPPNVVRTIAQTHGYAYGRSKAGLWVHLFGGNTLDTTLLDGGRVKLKQETAYPWAGAVKLTLESAPAKEMSLFVRVPAWAEGAALEVNGKPAPATAGRYAEIKRTWAAGDTVKLTLPMKPYLVESHPLVEEARNQVAVMCGPMVYCLESPDLPAGGKLQSIALPADAKLSHKFDRKLLDGVAVVETQAQVVADRPWKGELYRPLVKAESRSVSIKLIPYYAWGNRGKSEMTVWLPLGRGR